MQAQHYVQSTAARYRRPVISSRGYGNAKNKPLCQWSVDLSPYHRLMAFNDECTVCLCVEGDDVYRIDVRDEGKREALNAVVEAINAEVVPEPSAHELVRDFVLAVTKRKTSTVGSWLEDQCAKAGLMGIHGFCQCHPRHVAALVNELMQEIAPELERAAADDELTRHLLSKVF